MVRRAGPRGIEPRPRRFWRPAGHHDLVPTNGSTKLRPTWVPRVPAYRWPFTGLGLPTAGFLGAPGEFLIAARTPADERLDARGGARQGMAPGQRVGHRIQHHRRSIVPISGRASTHYLENS